LVGGEPMGLMLRVPMLFPYIPFTFLNLFSSKNLYLLILPAVLFAVCVAILLFGQIREKIDSLSTRPLSSTHFKTLRSMRLNDLILLPLLAFLLASFFQTQTLQTEFPHYPILATFARVYPDNAIFLFVFYILYFPYWLLMLNIVNRAVDRLAEQCIIVLAKKWQKQKPIISFEKVMKIFGLESINKSQFKRVLLRAAEIAEQDGTIYFGIKDNYLYLEDILTQLAKDEIKKRGEADINEIASKLQVKPSLLRKIYQKLKREELLRNVKITKEKIISYEKIKIIN
ncbi:MAG: hypothetical protein ACUVXA_18305, partial [Candidatus Jordarchaeum sp.]|uniref:hypothetical protein n=1 Tax=Candidatus Jordarchaeum sp. TaxID=2823881 RepID=UPI00404A5E7E